MYSYIKGQISRDDGFIIESNGIGYEIQASTDCIQNSVDTVYTYFIEDKHSLFGFATKEEKNLFLKLLNVSGIGPKSALNLLSHGYEYLVKAIGCGNITIKGVSKKTADKVILELNGKLEKVNINEEAVEALVRLGLPRNKVLEKIRNMKDLSTEEMIRAVLNG